MKFVRFQTGGQIKYGIAEGENIREIRGDLFGDHTPTGMVYAINTVKLLVPCTPSRSGSAMPISISRFAAEVTPFTHASPGRPTMRFTDGWKTA